MNYKHDIVCIGLPSWDGPYMKSTVQLMKGLARRNRVLYVEYPFTFKDLVHGLAGNDSVPVSRVLGSETRVRNPVADLNESLHVLTLPPAFPANGLPVGEAFDRILRLNCRSALRAIKSTIRSLGFKSPIVINALNPTYGWMLKGQLDEILSIYYCYDEIRGQAWNARHGASYEDRFIQSADLVVTTSNALLASKRQLNSNCALVQNGVDFDLFSQSADPSRHLLRKKQRVIGYVGNLDDRLDYDLLTSVVSMSPESTFLFVGHVTSSEAHRLVRYPNVMMVGAARRYEDLPSWLGRMDVGLIPFVKNRFTANIYPMKINEYLAAGLPVVRTDFNDLPEFDRVCAVATTPDEFLRSILCSISSNSREKVEERIEHARSNSWTERVTQFERHIDVALAENSISQAA
jgi:glycosyltransferase involved in cell wall biosynthesis